MQFNPFIYGRALTPDEFLGRQKLLRRVFGKLATGQSTAIIGDPHIGKTSLLKYIADADARRGFGVAGYFKNDLFCFLDAQTLHGIESQAQFWQQALKPLSDRLSARPNHALATLYRTAEENEFGTFVLEQLLREFHRVGGRLILSFDEFDAFLNNPVLHKAEFYGGLRSLASRFPAFVLLIASRQQLDQLNQLTQEINPHGSPYFNVFTEYSVGVLTRQATEDLLIRAGSNFDQDDRNFVQDISGRHPYLAQTAAAMLWEVHEEGLRGKERYRETGHRLYHQSKKHFADTWRVWTNQKRKAVTAVALAQIPYLAEGRTFKVNQLTNDLYDYTPELETLKLSGLVDKHKDGQWYVTQHAFLWWLADELWRNVRDEMDFRTWLQRNTMDGVLTRGEKQRMGQIAQNIRSWADRGAMTFIEAYAKQLTGGV